jgi:hypothetical protein
VSLASVAIFFIAKARIEAYLRGPEFLRFVSAKTGAVLDAEVELAPFHFDGLSVYSDGLKARGYEGAAFSEAHVEQIRARFSLRRFFDGFWVIDDCEAQRVRIRLHGTRLASPATSSASSAAQAAAPSSGFLPKRVDLTAAKIRDFELTWGDLPTTAGGLRGVSVQATPSEGGWHFDGLGGELAAANLPSLDVKELHLRQRGDTLFINTARFAARSGGTVNATGEVRFGERVDLRMELDGIDIAPFLSPDWRLRLHGKVGGFVKVESPLPSCGALALSGMLRLDEGRLEALPILNQVAVFTRSQRFRQLTLTQASADFTQEKGRLVVTHLVAESAGLARVEGGFKLADRMIDGEFQMGVAPSSLQWIPGSRERVFTVERNGYLWAPLRLSGPLDSPSEDLSVRLAAAAGDVVVDQVETTTREVLRTGQEAARGALDLLLPLTK